MNAIMKRMRTTDRNTTMAPRPVETAAWPETPRGEADLPSRLTLRRIALGAYRRLRVFQQHQQRHEIDVPPEWVKHEYIRRWANHTGYRVFVETGTYYAATTRAVASAFATVHTVEYDEELFCRAQRSLLDLPHITAHHGDSAKVLPSILATLDEPAIFWLDAHYCGGAPRSPREPPILHELGAIFGHAVKDHVVLVDDARWFSGAGYYPTVRWLERYVRRTSPYQMRIYMDIVHIHKEMI